MEWYRVNEKRRKMEWYSDQNEWWEEEKRNRILYGTDAKMSKGDGKGLIQGYEKETGWYIWNRIRSLRSRQDVKKKRGKWLMSAGERMTNGLIKEILIEREIYNEEEIAINYLGLGQTYKCDW